MPRNLNGRVEVMFPVSDPRLVTVVREEILGAYLFDTVKARIMNPDGTYSRVGRDSEAPALNAQSWFLSERATTRLG
jgi:polyphosphate kinase